MGELRLPGLATGIDTSTLIQQLMTINSRRLAKYRVQKNNYEKQSTALTDLRGTVNAVNTAAAALADINKLMIFSRTSSDTDVLTLSVSSEANPGSHSIEINQLATSETWIQDTSTFNYKTDYVGGGNFIYSYHHKERVITAIENETTLQDLVNLINNDEENPGVTASLMYQGGKYHLMLSGQETGTDYQISLNTSSTEVLASSTEGGSFTDAGENASLSTKITELDEFTEGGGLQGNEFILISGRNHFGTDLEQLTLAVTANTTVGHLIDAINKHFDGVATAVLVNGEIRLTDHISGASDMGISLGYNNGFGDTDLDLPTMTVSTTGGGTSESLASLSSSSFIETQDAQSSMIKVDGYPSTTVSEVQTLTPDFDPTDGHYHLSYGGQTTGEIAYDASLVEIKAALEALSTVDADDITVDGDTDNGLAAGPLTFTFRDTAGDVSMLSIDDNDLTGPSINAILETTKGSDGWISRNSNSISDALTGVTLNLQDTTESGETVKITVSRNNTAIATRVQTLVDVFNSLITELKEKTEYDIDAKEMGILSNDIAVSFIKTQSRDPFVGIIDGFVDTIDSFIQASDIGLSIDGAGMMELDMDEFNNALSEDFMGVLEVLGAAKSGNSSSNIIQFYNASDKYTTAGTYDVQVDINDSHQITEVRIKLSTESTFRNNSTWVDGLITGISTFDDDGNPLYPENGLQLTVDLTRDEGTYSATVHVKQGVTGALEDLLNQVLEADGRLDASKGVLDDKILAMEKRIEDEEARLERIEARLINKYARLEKTLTILQQQLGAVSMISA